MTNNKIDIKIILLWVLSITTFIQMQPYFVWSTYKSGSLSLLVRVSLYASALLIIIFLLMSHRKININTAVTVISLAVVRMYMLITGAESTSFFAIGNYIILTVMIGFFFLTEGERAEVFNKFSIIFAISLISGIIVWIATNFGFQLPYQYLLTEHAGKATSGIYYQKYFGSAFLYSPTDKLIRLSAMYDEPGVVGTLSALFLIADDFRFKGRLRNVIILLGGILSFSTAFYIIVVIGIAIISFNKSFFKLSLALIIFLGLFQGLMTLQTDNTIIKDVFQRKFQIVDGSMVGDNRASKSFDYAFKEFIQGDFSKVLFGYGANASNNNAYMYGSYTYKMLIYDFGIIGFTMLLLWLVLATIKMVGFDKRCGVLLIVFIISIYQRPYVLTIPYIFLLFGGYANLKSIENQTDRNIKEIII